MVRGDGCERKKGWHGVDLACHGMHDHGRGDQATVKAEAWIDAEG
jgi:hypothetical protein